MSQKSGISNQIISLPQGGGALKGLGENFSPDLFTGTGNFTVPIALPPGRNGFQPQLNLAYSTGQGNGPYGLGWGLSIPGIGRKTSRGIPAYDDATDIFILSGAEDLIPLEISTAQNGSCTVQTTRYQPRTEGLFANILHVIIFDRSANQRAGDYWQVQSKDGLTSFYGTPRPEEAEPAWQDPAVIADPLNPAKIFTWCLSRTLDPFGNVIEYVYEPDQGRDGPHCWHQAYLSEIRYADYQQEAITRFLLKVRFKYTNRPDPFSHYRSGFEIRTRKRCHAIEIYSCPGTENKFKTFQLNYWDEKDSPADPAACFPNQVSLLQHIKVIGHQGDASEEIPPLEMNYSGFAPEERRFLPLAGHDLPAQTLSESTLEQVDLFGTGLPDFVEMNGSMRYWRNLGQGRFSLPLAMKASPAGVHLEDAGVQFIDANGNGRPDLMVTQGSVCGYYPMQMKGGWDQRSFQSFAQAPSFNLADPEVKLVDLDGDGITDAIRSGSQLECYFNHPQLGWHKARYVPRRDLEHFPNVQFSDSRVRWADISGDGLQDIVLIHDGLISYWPNLGRGNWGKRIAMASSPRFPYGYDPKRILLGDVDGDGLADVIYVEDTKIQLWINRSGNSWSDSIEIKGTPPVTDMDSVRLVDLLGTGTPGLLWSIQESGQARTRYFFLDLTGGTKPYLLNRVDNHLGAITTVEYAPSTRFYLEDEQNPATRWHATLPFPVQVVAKVEMIDALSQGKFSTEYSYHHGYWDGLEREFRGFGRVDQRDTETFVSYHNTGINENQEFASVVPEMFSPPLETRTWFHQGAIENETGGWREADYSQEYWSQDASLLQRPPEVQHLLRSLRPADQRDALRALRGTILRTETYALDGSYRQSQPYTVTESQIGLREESKPINDKERKRIFFPYAAAQRTTQWERGNDPMTHITFSGDYDAYGQPRAQTVVALPRRSSKRVEHPTCLGNMLLDETRILSMHTRTTYAFPDQNLYLHNRVAHIHTFELRNPPQVIEPQPDNLVAVMQDHIQAAYAVNRQFQSLLNNWHPGLGLPGVLNLISHALNHYDGEAFIGRQAHQVGPFGALTRQETLVMTDEILNAAYGDRRPVCLGGSAQLPPGAPPDFGANIGCRLEQPSAAGYQAGYYCNVQCRKFDFQDNTCGHHRGLTIAQQDGLGNQTGIVPDALWLLPQRMVDAAGLETRIEYDYSILQPKIIIDPNHTATHFEFTPLGLLKKQYLTGNQGEGGTSDKPEGQFEYNFSNYQLHGQPIYVHARQRIHHARADISDETIEYREYSDGFGRVIQKRSQAGDFILGANGNDTGLSPEPGSQPDHAVGIRQTDRVIVSGWPVFNNKGLVVEKYEPFFATGWDFQPTLEAKIGQHATLYYDARGQMIRTLNPDGSEQRVILGIPPVLSNPADFLPTAWETYTYDLNDLAPLSIDPDRPGESLSRLAPVFHHFTPSQSIVNAQGKTIAQISRNGNDPGQTWHLTRTSYDIRGNVLEIIDALGRTASRQAYDLPNRPLRNESADAGLRTSVCNAMGNVIEYRDSNGAIGLRSYDRLNRLQQLWARDTADALFTLREKIVYGDDQPGSGLNQSQAREMNLLGRIYRHYDEAGRVQILGYDFKGNLCGKTRQVIRDEALARDWIAHWDAPDADQDLDEQEFQTRTQYDALNRPTSLTYPQDVNGHCAVLKPLYNRAGNLEKVDLDNQTYVNHIAYDAHGRRLLIAYGNGIMTRYVYHPRSFRLARMRSERYQPASPPDTWIPFGPALQDCAYQYDLAGNLTAMDELHPGSGVPGTEFGPDRLLREFAYDPLYQLLSATGREYEQTATTYPWQDRTTPQDPTKTSLYTQRYNYDAVGNMLSLKHVAANGGFTRTLTMRPKTNQLQNLAIGGNSYAYHYDANGNIIREYSNRHFVWDHANRLKAFYDRPAGSGQATVSARYLYGADGARVKKWVKTSGAQQAESTVSIDRIFEHHQWGGNTANNHLHVMDSARRLALIRCGPAHPDDKSPETVYLLDDHLGSSNLVLGQDGTWTNREEYTPYGETSFGSFAKKRYRFTGQERDEENGLNHHAARYYAPWLAKWTSCDPMASNPLGSPYTYAMNSPFCFLDPTGAADQDVSESAPAGQKISIHSAVSDDSKNSPATGPSSSPSILNVQPLAPLSAYPEKLTVPTNLLGSIRQLRKENLIMSPFFSLINDLGEIERCGIVTAQGDLLSHSINLHMQMANLAGENPFLRSLPEETSLLLLKLHSNLDPQNAEIDFHSHPRSNKIMPGFSPADVDNLLKNAAFIKNPPNSFLKSLLADSTGTLLLLIPTQESVRKYEVLVRAVILNKIEADAKKGHNPVSSLFKHLGESEKFCYSCNLLSVDDTKDMPTSQIMHLAVFRMMVFMDLALYEYSARSGVFEKVN
ncbi:VCBS repeat-containing protein [candidate division FCPU426 bacterium]|nr:VCBS repeat-containing protein [candidate division FCPU426 bacterium]